MKKDLTKLESHLARYPTDANGVISLLKGQSFNYEYEFNLERKKKLEITRSMARKKEGICNGSN